MKKLAVIASALLVPAGLTFAQTTPEAKPAAPAATEAAAVPATETATEAAPVAATLDSAAVGTAVENRELVGEGTTFPEGKVFCWSKIASASAATTIKHVWYNGTEKMLETPLNIPFTPYRTYSNKNVVPGNWKVEVVDATGAVLKSIEFTVTAAETAAPASETPVPVQAEQPAGKPAVK